MKHNPTPTQPDGKIRIIGGRWRRRSLPVAKIDGLRPTGNRVRETLFNWLMPHLHEARCLDLFAGSGALGLEALSRGARFVQFVESHSVASENLSNNLRSLNADTHEFAIHHGDALGYMRALADHADSKPAHTFDIVFLDPPFDLDLWQQSMDLLVSSTMLSCDALIYVESPRETKPKTPHNWHLHRSLNAGSINATLYRIEPARNEAQAHSASKYSQ